VVVPEADGFAEFVAGRSRELLRAGWLLTGDWALAEDLVQTALAATWPRWSQLARADRPDLYVRRVMVTTFLRWRRRRWNAEFSTGLLPDRPDRSDALAQVDVRASVAHALAVLPPRQRVVVVLRYFADLSEAETARVMGCSVGAVKSHAAKAFSRLRGVPGLAEIMTGGGTS
jgi:RNA polymerase sigma-70 factor (sigma-E family)